MTTYRETDGTVTSVQGLAIPESWDAPWLARTYMGFLGELPLVAVEQEEGGSFCIRLGGRDALRLRLSRERSHEVSFHVVGGVFSGNCHANPGVFKFTVSAGEATVRLQGFLPAMPWALYRTTQALAHEAVVQAYGRYLERLGSR